MKRSLFFVRCLFVLALFSLFVINKISAQNNGILPLTGLRYFNEGIISKRIDVKIDGAQLLSNRVPLNKEIEIELQQPSGFILDNNRAAFAAAEVILLSPNGELLSKDANVLVKNQASGFAAKDLNILSIKFVISASSTKTNFNGVVKLRLYDLKGKNQLRLELPVIFARPGERLQVSKSIKEIKSPDGFKGMINGLQATKMIVNIDTSIKVAPKMAYTSMDISSIEGTSLGGIFEGKENFWVYDSDLNEVKITDILLKQVKGAMENNTINYTLKIPYRLKTSPAKPYTVRFRWESPDKSQVIDVVVNI